MDAQTASLVSFLEQLADALREPDAATDLDPGRDGRALGTAEKAADEPLALAACRLARAVLEDRGRREEETCELVSRLGHEIRTPLGSLLMTSEMLRDEAGSERSRLLAQRLGVAAREIRGVLEDTVELVKVRADRSELSEPDELDEEQLREIAREEGVELVGAAGTLTAPELELRLVFGALARAVSSAGLQGPPRLEVGGDDPLRGRLPFPGIEPSWSRPFAKKAPRGVGLHLARARAILQRLGGDLEIRSEPDPRDAALEIVLPRSMAGGEP